MDATEYVGLGINKYHATVLYLMQMVVAKIEELFVVLDAKRPTLEERMIKLYYYGLYQIFQELIVALLRGDKTKSMSPKAVFVTAEAVELVKEILTATENFLKAAHYDLLYLEQYYEHAFLGQLQTEWLFVERARKIISNSVQVA